MSASGPHRQRSLRDRIHQGITNLTWQGKTCKPSPGASFTSYAAPLDAAKPYVITSGESRSVSLDNHGYVNPLDWDVPSSKELSLGLTPIRNQDLTSNKNSEVICSVPSGEKAKSSSPTKNDTNKTLANKVLVVGLENKKMVTRSITQPEGTIPYTVCGVDTLAGIAARFYTTPSELVKVNKLSSRLIFPGQTMYVPKKSSGIIDGGGRNLCSATPPSTPVNVKPAVVSTGTSPSADKQKVVLNDVQCTTAMPIPGHVERVMTPLTSPVDSNENTAEPETTEVVSPTLSQEEEERKLDEECHKKFLKVNVRHITDGQGVVPGVLLVTPNALMFDPNVSDPLVIEHGPEKYSVICPMDMVANAAMYRDIAHMRLKSMENTNKNLPKAEVYHSKSCPMYQSEDDIVECEVDSETEKNEITRRQSFCSCGGDTSGIEKPNSATTPTPNKPSETEGMKSQKGTDVTEIVVDSSSGENRTEEKHNTLNPLQLLLNRLEGAKDANPKEEDEKFDDVFTDDNVSRKNSDGANNSENQTSLAKNVLSNFPISQASLEDKKNAWLSQLSSVTADIPLLPASIDFSLFKPHKSSTQSEGDSMLSASYADSSEHGESHKQRLLKRLSQPVSWIESFASVSVDSAVEITATAQSTLSRILPHPFSISSEKDEPSTARQQSARNFSASPHSFVDFSSGLFAQTDNVDDISKVSPNSGARSKFYLKSDSIDDPTEVAVGQSTFYESAESAKHVFLDEAEINKKKPVKIQNMVDEKPELFTSIDTMSSFDKDFELIPKPAKSCEDPPLYLCLLMGHPPKKNNSSDGRQKPPHRHVLMSYGQRCIKPEYWFSIPRDRVDELYAFFNMWVPGIYGDPSTIDFESKGYKLIETDEEFSDEDQDSVSTSKVSNKHKSRRRQQSSPRSVGSLLKMVEEHFTSCSPSWEQTSASQVVSIDELRQLSLDFELPLPDLVGKSEILDEEHRRSISDQLPARAEGYPWTLIYGNTDHGFSLKTMYREMSKYECPTLLVVIDTNDVVFGAMLSCTLKVSEHFYGTGESFLYTFNPEFKCFSWTGENNYFIKGAADSVAIGAGDGLFGLWLDEDLYKGRSHRCLTYNNETLSSNEDFIIKAIEAWGFM